MLNENYEHVDLDNLEDLDNQINNASNFYKEKASGVSDSNINKINSYIKNVITGVNSDNERYTYGDNQQIFFFIIQIMAVLYNNIDETQKRNVINYITKEIYNHDLAKWKNRIYPSLIEIESKLWGFVQILGPNFFGNTFNMHYQDVLITDLYGNTQIIYQFHTPYWELYYKRANKF